MPYNTQSNVLFIHIPKNAGKSVEVALGMVQASEQSRTKWRTFPNRAGTALQRWTSDRAARERLWGVLDVTLTAQHLTLQEVLLLGLVPAERLDTMRTVTVVRNPYSRAVSTFLHWRQPGVLATSEEFGQFLQRWSKAKIRDHNQRAHWRPQVDFVSPTASFSGRVDILRFETLASDLREWANKSDVQLAELPHLGKQRDAGEYEGLYTETSRAAVQQLFWQDFAEFGYNPTAI